MLDLPARISEWLLLLVRSQRSIAYLLVDGEHRVAGAGGDLAHYGLTDLRLQQPAADQQPFLEGLLPLPETPFLLRSLNMAGGRAADVHLFAEGESTWVVFLDVTTEHDEAQKIQQKAYDMTLLSQREARLIAKLEAAHKELSAAHHALAVSREALLVTHNRLRQELFDAERYVRAILPAPIAKPLAIDWRFVPSNELGGDSFGYHWLDTEHFALYLLDVCGHGVGAALMSVAVTNTLRSGALPLTDFRRPEEVIGALNRAYQMEDHNDMYFTIWYGVYHVPTGRLRYAAAGHPPPILVKGPSGERGTPYRLEGSGPLLGMMPTSRYSSEECALEPPARLFVFSDGVYEIEGPDDSMLPFEAFEEVLTRGMPDGGSELDELLHFAQQVRGAPLLNDDFSILKITI